MAKKWERYFTGSIEWFYLRVEEYVKNKLQKIEMEQQTYLDFDPSAFTTPYTLAIEVLEDLQKLLKGEEVKE